MEIMYKPQELGKVGAPVGGTFTLHHGEASTVPLPYNATQEQVQAAVYVMETEIRRGRQAAIRRRMIRRSAAAAAVLLVAVVVIRRARG